jgi:receptor protein-tyrosine kinase/non-specific protein-tyrosine kinase
MSRIEKAMEKAAQKRSETVTPFSETIQKHKDGQVHIPPQPESVKEKIFSKNPYLVNLNDPYSPIGEEFRKLKSSLVKLTKGEKFKNTIMVTSAVPNEGKSITALNLSISLAEEYDHTVLLIDSDLRRPSVHRYLDMEQRQGFAECLLGEANIGDIIIPTGIGKLSVITAGREIPNPVEMFNSQKMLALIKELKHRYPDRYIIFDTPPVLPFAETRTLAHLVDGVLFVVKERLASQNDIKDALETLKGCELLGLIYNDTIPEQHDERYSSYRYYSAGKR